MTHGCLVDLPSYQYVVEGLYHTLPPRDVAKYFVRARLSKYPNVRLRPCSSQRQAMHNAIHNTELNHDELNTMYKIRYLRLRNHLITYYQLLALGVKA